MHPRHPLNIRVLLVITVAAYIVIAILYAALTPTWQVPDEPAHYNYVRALAEDLERFLDDLPLRARRASAAERFRGTLRLS